MLHAAVKPSFPASGVTHSLVGQFSAALPAGETELVVFKQNRLELFRVRCAEGSAGAPLVYVAGVQLNAPPLAVAACRPPGFLVDVVVMCFDDFHVAFVQYDAARMRLHTLALVQLDEREVAGEQTPLEPIMRADPTGRFVTVLARRRQLFVIPLLGMNRPDSGNCDGEEKMKSNGHNDYNDNTVMGGNNNNNNNVKEVLAAADDWGDEDDYHELSAQGEDSSAPGENTLTQQQQEQQAHPESHNSKVLDIPDELVLCIGHISMFSISSVLKGTIHYIRDIQFIESSGEPIIAFLCERHPTWAGRVKLADWRTKVVESNMLSCQVVWVQVSSAATSNRNLLLIGEVDSVPYNVTHMTPVRPFAQIPSGVVCYGINTVMHITTKRGFGVYLNNGGMEECANNKSSAVSFGKASWSDSKLEASKGLLKANLSLADCTAALVDNKEEVLQLLAVSKEDGVVVTLSFTAQSSSVQNICIDILGTDCYCSSISYIKNQIVFMGSAHGDSYIARVDQTLQGDAGVQRFKIIECLTGIGFVADIDIVDCTSNTENSSINYPIANNSGLDDTPYAELMGSTILDPMRELSLAECRAVMDLAVCTGRGSSGSIYIMRQSVRNNLFYRLSVNAVSVFLLEPSYNRKRLRRDAEGDEEKVDMSYPLSSSPPLLILTGLVYTIVMAVYNESLQQERFEFATNCRTIFATEIPKLNVLLQVTESEGRLISLDGKKLIQKFNFVLEQEVGKQRVVKSASMDPDLLLLFVLVEDGTLFRVSFKTLQTAPTKELFAEKVTAFALWKEERRVVTFTMDAAMVIREMVGSHDIWAAFPQFATLPPYSILDANNNNNNNNNNNTPKPTEESSRNDGGNVDDEIFPQVAHVEMVTLRSDSVVHATSLLVILTSGELAGYRVMTAADHIGKFRLIKYMHHFLDTKAEREVIESIEMKKQRLQRERLMNENDTQMIQQCSRRIIPFDGIRGNAGAYVCGQHPIFLFWDKQTRELVSYRDQTPGPVRGFAPFPSVDSGYIYCREGFVDFAQMNTYCQPSGYGWLTRRIHLGVTPHFVVYHPPAQCCFVVTSKKECFRPKRASFDLPLHVSHDEEAGGIQNSTTTAPVCDFPPIDTGKGIRVPMNDRFEIRLMSTTEWICLDALLLEENERVLGAQMIELPYEEQKDGKLITAPVCVVSTAFPLGEDVTCRGRILILKTMCVKKKKKIILLHSEPLNGPATAIIGIRNHIAVAVGGTIRIFHFDSETKKLGVRALLYADFYVTKMSAFRDYLIYGDVSRSCAIARFNQKNHTLNILGKDRGEVSVVHCDMMYHDRSFGILCSDDQRNLLVLGYTPRVQEAAAERPARVLESVLSLDGEHRLPGGSLVKSLRLRSLAGGSCVAVYATNYGELGFIVPLGEKANRTASWLTRRLQMDAPHAAGLTPRMFLGLSQGSPRTARRAKEMLISAPLLSEFFFLDIRSRKTIASAAYTQAERIMSIDTLIYEECNLF